MLPNATAFIDLMNLRSKIPNKNTSTITSQKRGQNKNRRNYAILGM